MVQALKRLLLGCQSHTRRTIFTASPEQSAIVDRCRTHNVVVSAKPGSGKTTTAGAIAEAFQDSPIIALTYSKRLQLSTADRLANYPRASVLTFHGLAGKLFNTPEPVNNDLKLHKLLHSCEAVPSWSESPCDIVILDELQDCTPLLYWLICVFLASVKSAQGKPPRVVVLGDPEQAIYDYRGADDRYLSLAPSIFGSFSTDPWDRMSLDKSYRLSHANSNLINEAFVVKPGYIKGSHAGPRPQYMYCDSLVDDVFLDKLVPVIEQYGPENTAILAPSVRLDTELAHLENELCKRWRYPIAISLDDDSPLNDKVLENKLAISTYHQFKGSERDLVIVCGVDNLYFKIFGKDLPTDCCPRAVYVALTRAIQQLVIVHSFPQDVMPFVHWRAVEQLADFHNLTRLGQQPSQAVPAVNADEGLHLPERQYLAVSDIPRHINEVVLDSLLTEFISAYPPLPEDQHIRLTDIVPTIFHDKLLYEQVNDINGLVIVAAFEFDKCHTLHTLEKVDVSKVPLDAKDRVKWLSKTATDYQARVHKSRKLQMTENSFDWLVPDVGRAVERLSEQFAEYQSDIQFEVPFSSKFTVQGKGNEESIANIAGRADIVETSNNGTTTIWEIKFVSYLSPAHAVQVLIYGYLWMSEKRRTLMPRMVLFNVRDGAKWEIQATPDAARQVIEKVLLAKYESRHTCSDEEFEKQCEQVARTVHRWSRRSE
ncbi:P-loop containing nucleoside triphosphate hydrolase protein [Neolentinus lepideus HHB14362 ss-1]|uniref:p-loop containing nucleoside triphosphate hydrolase protein n=1 Tax=Neolentinus lepideus HHB14362 ss-1 TaxID=1314782 RepID=A0A165T560_9AGAM|nr:P-loop containing nucleoside triphosphate hydrolase protein [Neolentinus lepideus HHB14362 ss-1]